VPAFDELHDDVTGTIRALEDWPSTSAETFTQEDDGIRVIGLSATGGSSVLTEVRRNHIPISQEISSVLSRSNFHMFRGESHSEGI